MVTRVAQRRLHPAFCAALVWAVIAVLAVGTTASDYLNDLATFQSMPVPPGGWQAPARSATSATTSPAR